MTSPLALEDPRVNRRPLLLPDFLDDFSDEEEFRPVAQGRIPKPRKEKAPNAPKASSTALDSASGSNSAPKTQVAAGSEVVTQQNLYYNKDYYDVMTENYVPPGQQRNLRACMVCSIVMTQSRFLKEGCPNCEEFLRLQGNMEAIIDCTSQVFEGLITLADPAKSWVAKWQRLDGYVKGVYATKVSGQLPDEVVAFMEDEARIRYIPRDGSATEAD